MSYHPRRRPLLAGLAALATANGIPRPTLAQAPWPNRPVRVLVGFPPGGSLDVMTRVVAEQVQARLGQPFVVETRSGASGNVGAEALARAVPDGYTIGTLGMPTVLINPMLFSRLPFDPERDFTWIAQMWEFPNVAVVPTAHVPARSLGEFIDWAKRRPDGVSYGSAGVGTTIHLSGAYLAARAGFTATHVPFRGAAQTVPAMLAGDVHYAVDNLASYVPVIQEGRMRALAITSAQRWPTLPEVPTMAEAGMDNFIVTSWHMWAAPTGAPKLVVDRLVETIRSLYSDPGLQQRALAMGARLLGSTPEEVTARLARERPIWAEMVRISGARAE
jgi:tripartite-type tricarboxylate transporter receptor subunit TctC